MFKDKIGQDVVVGDYIVYGHNISRSAGLRVGKVLSIDKRKGKWTGDDFWSIGIIGVDDDCITELNPMTLLNKKSTLNFPNRILKINNIITKEYTDLLEGKDNQK